MQAALRRPPGPSRGRRASISGAKPPVATANDSGLLDALPIAAAIVERRADRSLKVTAHNSPFTETIEQSSCVALDWNDSECLKAGPIADLLQEFFDGGDL